VARAERQQRERIGKRGEPVPSEAAKLEARKASAANIAAAQRSAREVVEVSHAQAARLRRRSRLVTTVFLLAAIAASVVGGVQLAAGAGWLLLAAGLAGSVLAVLVLRRMAAVAARAAERARPAVPAERPARRRIVLREPSAEQDEDRSWTPREVPKPLYLRRTELRLPPELRAVSTPAPAARQAPVGPAEPVVERRDPAAELTQAALAAERALRAAHAEPEVSSIQGGGLTDLDAVLRRRSAG
jgi:hypothetical protein